MLGGVCVRSEMINKDDVQLPPLSNWVKKHLTTSQTTPKWSVGSLMCAVLPLKIPQRPEVDPAKKAVWKMRASTFKIMKEKTILYWVDFIFG